MVELNEHRVSEATLGAPNLLVFLGIRKGGVGGGGAQTGGAGERVCRVEINSEGSLQEQLSHHFRSLLEQKLGMQFLSGGKRIQNKSISGGCRVQRWQMSLGVAVLLCL